MAIFLDSANLEEIEKVSNLPFISGITTNPLIMKKENVKNEFEYIKKIGERTKGVIFAHINLLREGQEKKTKEIIEKAKKLSGIFPGRIIVKMPFSLEVFSALPELHEEKILTCITAIGNAMQIYISALMYPLYGAVYVGRIFDKGRDGVEVIRKGMDAILGAGLKMKILAASIKNKEVAEQLITIPKVDLTVPFHVLNQLMDDEITKKAIEEFEKL